MAGSGGAKGQSSPHVRLTQVGIVGHDVVRRGAVCEQIEDVGHADARSSDVRPAAANRRIDVRAIARVTDGTGRHEYDTVPDQGVAVPAPRLGVRDGEGGAPTGRRLPPRITRGFRTAAPSPETVACGSDSRPAMPTGVRPVLRRRLLAPLRPPASPRRSGSSRSPRRREPPRRSATPGKEKGPGPDGPEPPVSVWVALGYPASGSPVVTPQRYAGGPYEDATSLGLVLESSTGSPPCLGVPHTAGPNPPGPSGAQNSDEAAAPGRGMSVPPVCHKTPPRAARSPTNAQRRPSGKSKRTRASTRNE